MKRIFFVTLGMLILTTTSGVCAAEDNEVELEKIVVTPTRVVQSEYRTTSNVTVIDSKKIEASGARYVADILEEGAGINIYACSTDKTVKVDIRGFADTSVSNVLVLVNGRKVNSIDISGPDWLQIPVEAIERIEVLRGAGSVLYGDNAVGGVVNIITKKGKGPISGRIGVMYGSYNMQQENLEISGSQDNLSYYLYSKYHDTEGYRSNADVLTKDFNARLGYMVSENLSFDLTAGWHKDDYGMPGGLDDISELVQYGRRGSTDPDDFASTKDRYVKLSFDSKPHIKDMDLGTFVIDVSYRNRDAYSWFYYGGWPTATKYMIDTKGITAKHIYNGAFSGREFNLVTGVDYYDVEHIIKGSEWNWDDLTIYKEELGFYVYSDYELLNKLFINGGARYQKADYRFDQRAASVRYETKNPSESVFMGGAKYEYADGSNLHFSVQETFRFLATDEWFSTWTGLNTDLNQQTGIQYEIGIKHNFFDTILLNATSYCIDLKNEIYLNPAVYPGHNENYDRTRRKGVELGLTLDLMKLADISFLDNLSLYTNYTYQQPKFRGGDYGDNDIPMVPRHQANVGLMASFFKNYRLTFAGNYVGERYAINDTGNETPKVKDHVVWDGKILYKNDFLEIYASVNNIFNEKYNTYVVKSTGSTLKDYYPSPERNFVAGVSISF